MRPRATLPAFAASLFLLATPVSAGTLSLAWDPVSNPNLTDYRVYWGSTPGTYDQYLDVRRETSVTLSDLADCTVYHVGVKSRDVAGNQSASFLSVISGFPRPRVAEITPTTVPQGRDLSFVIRGANFMNGAVVRFLNPHITVNSVTFGSCTELTASVRVGGDATVVASTVEVTNPDRSFGRSAAIFIVDAALVP